MNDRMRVTIDTCVSFVTARVERVAVPMVAQMEPAHLNVAPMENPHSVERYESRGVGRTIERCSTKWETSFHSLCKYS